MLLRLYILALKSIKLATDWMNLAKMEHSNRKYTK